MTTTMTTDPGIDWEDEGRDEDNGDRGEDENELG